MYGDADAPNDQYLQAPEVIYISLFSHYHPIITIRLSSFIHQMYDIMGAKSSEELIKIANEKYQSQHIYGDDPDAGNIYGDGKVSHP